MLKILVYPSQYTSIEDASPEEVSWEDFKTVFVQDPEVVVNKGSAAQYFPGTMKEGAKSKGDSSVDRLYLYPVDADGITPEEYAQLLASIQREGVECVVHSTHSHQAQIEKDGTYRVRVIFPLKRPVLADEWRIFWSNGRITFNALADPTTAAPSKHYLAAALPPGDLARESFIFEEFKTGKLLDPDEMMNRHGIQVIAESEIEAFDVGKETVTGGMFKEMVIRRRRGDDLKVANALKSALGKNAYAEPGTREQTLFAIAGLLAKEFPRGNPDDLCEPLRYSIEHEEKKGGPKFSEFRDKVVRRQRDILKRAAEKRAEAAKDLARAAIKRDLSETFTAESLEPYIKRCGNKFTFTDLKDRLILIHRNNYYVFDGSGYKVATSMSLHATVRKYLLYAAEENLEFSYFFPSDGGKPPTPKTPDAFVKDHGDVVDQVRYTYEGVSWYDPEKSILWLSEVESLSRLVPERSEKVEAWMRAGCPNVNQRRRWEHQMAQYSNTNNPLAGLVLIGPSGTGKSAYAEGMAKMFGDAPPCSMANYFSNFNTEVLFNPLVFADESFPEINGKVPTERLRTLISAGTHEVNRKGRDIATLRGYVRCILAFQNLKKFDFGRGHTREDIEAIEKRYLIIKLEEAAVDLFDYDHFVTNLALAKHALYLAETMPRASSRFGVETSGSDAVIAGDPIAMNVADWLIEYLLLKVHSSSEVKASAKRVTAFVNNGKIYVNVTMLRKEWERYGPASTKYKTPSQGVLAEAVRSLSVDPKATRVRMGSGDESFWLMKNSILKSRALALDLMTEEQFDLLLRIPHELLYKTKSFKLTNDDKMIRQEALKQFKGKAEAS